ncbi:MAG: PDZ domain-containing protein [Bacteroidetes bacterium]|nr:MAG: PDZ domain-containing protein [Bacteroidota bacterium]
MKKLLVGWVIVLLLLAKAGYTQEYLEAPASTLLTKFRFRMLHGGVLLVEGLVANKADTLQFVLDTGSSGISLDSSLVARLQLPVTPSDKVVKGIGGVKNVSFVRKQSLRLPGLTIDSLDFHINDYELLTSAYGTRIDGVIGYSFLRKFIVAVNYDSSLIAVYTPGSFKYGRGGHVLKPRFTNLPIVHAVLTDETKQDAKYFFDTGAGLCFLLNAEFTEDSGLFKKRRKFYPALIEGIAGKQAMKCGVVKQVQVGPYKFRNVPGYVFADSFNITNYPSLAGLLGNDLLKRFNLVINYPDQEIHIKPNTKFREPFDYAYLGCNLYQVDNVIVFGEVLPNTPAAKAGLLDGDVFVHVDNVYTNSLPIVKAIMQAANTKFTIGIIRNGVSLTKKLTVGSLL